MFNTLRCSSDLKKSEVVLLCGVSRDWATRGVSSFRFYAHKIIAVNSVLGDGLSPLLFFRPLQELPEGVKIFQTRAI